jgi:hypothetical protein
MNSNDITKGQAGIISDALYPGFNYVARLREPMERAGFPPGDKLY